MPASPELPSSPIVIIEDDPSVLSSLREAIEAAGFGVRAFTSPFLALASMRQSVPDVLVLDWHLAELNGYVVLEHLRNASHDKPRVLVLTGDVRLEVSPTLAEVMRKPVSLVRLVERVRALASIDSNEASGASSPRTGTV